MANEPKLEQLGAALADASRVRMLCELMDGRAHTGKELALVAEIAPSTASEHLAKLRQAGLVAAQKSGRHVYYRIASDAVAEALERLSALTPSDHLYRGACENGAPELVARSCYHHLAGRLGVLIARAFVERGWVRLDGETASLTPASHAPLRDLGLPVDADRPLAVNCCLDWSERRLHFSGPLGKALLQHALSHGWLRRPRYGRALLIEARGYKALHSHFGIRREDLCGRPPTGD